MCSISQDIQNETDKRLQLERYLINEDNLTGEDYAILVTSDFICPEVKAAMAETLEQMLAITEMGNPKYKEIINEFRREMKGRESAFNTEEDEGTDEFPNS